MLKKNIIPLQAKKTATSIDAITRNQMIDLRISPSGGLFTPRNHEIS
jgi:hypothetical protein